MMDDIMRLEQMELFGKHGVFPEENHLGQKFIVDLTLQLDLRLAGVSDDLEHTVNYADVYQTVKEIVEGPPLKLIETLAEKIAQAVLTKYDKVKRLTVKVTKPNPPFAAHFRGVSVQIERKRAEQ